MRRSISILFLASCSTAPFDVRGDAASTVADSSDVSSGGDATSDTSTGSGGDEAPPSTESGEASTDTGSGDCLDDSCDPPPAFLDGVFPIGVFVQPPEMFDTWQARGIDTVIGCPDGYDVQAWNDAAMQRGLYVVRPPLGDAATDAENPLVLAWTMRDEPDIEGASLVDSIGSTYEQYKFLAPDQPVFLNFAGWNIMATNDTCNGPGDDAPYGDCYPSYIASSDWVGQDNYPVTFYDRPDDLALVGRTLDKLAGWAAERPLFAYIETSDTNLGAAPPTARGVKPAELRAEMWNAIIHGARGIFLFPVTFDPWQFDATPADVADELAVQAARIHALAPVLQTAIDPPSLAVELEPPLEATWRDVPDGAHVVVLHLPSCLDPDACPSTTASFTVTGLDGATAATVVGEDREVAIAADGTITDDFAPYEVHVYRVP